MAARLNIFDKILFDSFPLSPEALALYRISFALFLMAFGVPNFTWISKYPAIFYNPPLISLNTFLTGFPSYEFLFVISTGTCLLSILLLFGLKTQLTTLLLALFIFTGKSFAYSFGKIDHDFLIWVIPLVMYFSNWGAAYSLDAKIKPNGQPVKSWPIVFLAIILCIAMFSAGLPKLLEGWLNVSTQAVRGHFLREYYINERQSLLAPFFLNLDFSMLWEFFDYAGVLLEILFLFAFVRPNLFRFFVICAIFFHLFNYLILNISFTTNFALYLLFIDWPLIIKKLKKYHVLKLIHQSLKFKNLLIVAIIYTSFYIFFILSSDKVSFDISPLTYLLQDVLHINDLLVKGLIIGMGLTLALFNLLHYIRNKNKVADKTYTNLTNA